MRASFPDDAKVSLPKLGQARRSGGKPRQSEANPHPVKGQPSHREAETPAFRQYERRAVDYPGARGYADRHVHPLSAACAWPWEQPMRIFKAVIAEDEPVLRAELK